MTQRWTLGPAHPDYGISLVEWHAPAPGERRGRPPGSGGLKGRWSTHYDHCQQCGTTARPHRSKGLCVRCKSRAISAPVFAP